MGRNTHHRAIAQLLDRAIDLTHDMKDLLEDPDTEAARAFHETGVAAQETIRLAISDAVAPIADQNGRVYFKSDAL